jgi:hypothetical protein
MVEVLNLSVGCFGLYPTVSCSVCDPVFTPWDRLLSAGLYLMVLGERRSSGLGPLSSLTSASGATMSASARRSVCGVDRVGGIDAGFGRLRDPP